MNAIIFAAGLGTRLRPLTNDRPKALVEINGKPLLYYAINQVKQAGVKKVVVNVHHYADMIIDYLNQQHWGVEVVVSDERNELLETGGGILKAQHLLDDGEPFIAFNVDIVSSVNLAEVLEYHKAQNALVTLVVRKRETSRYFLFNDAMQLTGWKNITSGEEKPILPDFQQSGLYAFSGIHILSPEIFNLIDERGKFSVVPLYLRLAATHKLVGYADTSDFWLDLGKPGQIELAREYLSELS